MIDPETIWRALSNASTIPAVHEDWKGFTSATRGVGLTDEELAGALVSFILQHVDTEALVDAQQLAMFDAMNRFYINVRQAVQDRGLV